MYTNYIIKNYKKNHIKSKINSYKNILLHTYYVLKVNRYTV